MTGRAPRLAAASGIAVVATAAILSGSGVAPSTAAAARGPHGIPAGLADAIHARFGAGAIRSSSAARATSRPQLGLTVALSADGTTALVGSFAYDRNHRAAYVFHVSDAGSWSSSDTPTAVLTKTHESIGYEVALSADGTTAFIGAPEAGRTTAAEPPPGAIYVFHVAAEDAWASSSTPTATLTVSDSFVLGAWLAVSPDGTTLVAGQPFLGAVVFHASSQSAWASSSSPTAILSKAGTSPNASVAISGDGTTVLMSDCFNANGGGADVYHVSAEDAWTSTQTPTAVLSDANSALGDFLGCAVALSGDGTVAFLGADGVDAGSGAVDVFRASSEDTWASTSTPTATLTGGSVGSLFGARVTVSTDGTTALVTAPGLHHRRGAAYIFRVSGEGAWASSSTPTATLTHAGDRANDFLGIGDALSGDGATALVGAPYVRFRTGEADVFHVSDASSWVSSSTPTAILTVSALERCVVPRVIGRTVSAAKSALRARSCRLGRVTRVVRPKAKTGRVVFQSQKPGLRLPVGTKVAVKLAK